MPDTGADAVELADELVEQGGEQGAHVGKNVTTVVLPLEWPEVVSLSVSIKNACDEATSTKEKLDALHAAAELA